MKTGLCVLFGLGLISSEANAQSSVTLFGVADIYTEFLSNQQGVPGSGAATSIRMASGGKSGSRWGLKGTEDLGEGWQAVFKLESDIDLNTGSGVGSGGFDRSAWVGLQNVQWGTLRLGRQYTTLFDIMEHYSPTVAYSTIYEPDGAIVGLNFRENNVVKYLLQIGNLLLESHYSVGGTAGAFQSGAGSGAGFDYNAGALSFAAAYDDINGTAPGAISHFRRYAASSVYTLARLQLVAGVTAGNGNVSTPGVVTRYTFYWIGTRYQVSDALQIIDAFYYEDIKAMNPALGQPATRPANPQQVTLQLNYFLSKATTLYLTSGYVRKAALDFDNYNYNFLNYSLAANRSSSLGIALGMRKTF